MEHDPRASDRATDDATDRRRAGAAGGSPDDAHRRAAFGRRPDDVPALPERRRRVWPWVVAALLVFALVPLLVARLRPEGTTTAVAGGEVAGGTAVERYLAWAADGSAGAAAPGGAGATAYAAQGIRLLADALDEATRTAGFEDAPRRVAELRAYADSLEGGAAAGREGAHARAAFTGAARLVAELHDRDDAAASNGGALMSYAAAVDAARPLAAQPERVRRFFLTAAEALD